MGHIGDLVVPLHINDLNCTGNESTIEDCPSNGLSKYNCDDSHDAAISCNGIWLIIIIIVIDYAEISVEHSDCIDGDLRLSSGSAELSGRVEVCYSNVWFVVCVDNFNSNYFPTTICKQLNHSSYGIDIANFSFYLLYFQMQLAIWIHLVPTQDFLISHMSLLAIVVQKDSGVALNLSLIALMGSTDMLELLVKVSCLLIFNKGLVCRFCSQM